MLHMGCHAVHFLLAELLCLLAAAVFAALLPRLIDATYT
jgi:hypothetical protein